MSFNYNFSAVKGIQAERDYYIAMVPLGLLAKLFNNEEEYLLPEYRAQRSINEARIPEIKDYILGNRSTYVFSALSASIDGEFEFRESELDSNLGVLSVDMNATFLINDGQHRKAAIEMALKECPELAKETIAIVFFKDEGLKRSQQMFADLNKHAVKPSKSLSTLYDDRDDLSNAVKAVVKEISFLDKYIDKERDSLAKYSSKLFTLANFLRANQRIIKEASDVSEEDRSFLLEYWKAVFTYIPEWNMLETKKLYKTTLKEEYILTLSVVINAFGRLGHYFYNHQSDMTLLKGLGKIDWLRSNSEWESRVFKEGKIIGKEEGIIRICNLIKLKLGIELSKEEMVKENDAR